VPQKSFWEGTMNLHSRRQFLHLATRPVAVPAPSQIAWAQAYPTRPVRIVVGFAAGDGLDIIARLIGQRLSERLHQTFIIDISPTARRAETFNEPSQFFYSAVIRP
jgi:tripartite-type tricarboxylate transporter receptor subunit TctC